MVGVLFRMKTRNLQRTTSNIQLRSAEIERSALGVERSTFAWFLVEKDSGSAKGKRSGKIISNLQLYGGCASLEEAFT